MDLARQQIRDASSRSVDLSGAVLDETVNRVLQLDIGNKNLIFDDCEIQSDIVHDGTAINGALSFKNTVVKGKVSIKNTVLDGVNFAGSDIQGDFFLTNVQSKSYFYLDNSSIAGGLNLGKVTFGHVFSVIDSVINAHPDFQRHTHINNCTFENMVEFKGCTIKKAFVFNNSTINSQFLFEDVRFECDLTSPVFAAVHITNNTISRNANLKFIGLNDAKMFEQAADVIIADNEVDGEVLFEHCNLQKVDHKARQQLVEDSRDETSGIIIGDGCLKYRVQSPVKTIPANAVTENIIRELSASFANYFLASNGFNLGVEFVSKQIHEIKLFYYTDENIDQVEFNRRLQITEEEYWGFSIAETALVSEQQMTGLIDTYISKLSLLAKIKLRQENGLWNEENMQNVLQAISFGDALPIAPKEVNLYIENLKINKGLTIEKQNNFGGSQQFGDNIINT
jgi:uncharacterized protein YjbI with pentapeptide repeats